MSGEYVLKLYVMGETEKSLMAIRNLRSICENHLKGEYALDIIDLTKNMQLAEDEKIFALPMLERRLPKPIRRLIGDLSNKEKVLFGLGLDLQTLGKKELPKKLPSKAA